MKKRKIDKLTHPKLAILALPLSFGSYSLYTNKKG